MEKGRGMVIRQIQAVRRRVFRTPAAPRRDLRGRKLVVTGTSEHSLGHATAKILLEWGADVTVTRRRDTESLVGVLRSEVGNANAARVTGRDLDLSSAESVEAFASWYEAERGELDVLVNNAGIHLDLLSRWKEPRRTEDGFELHWRTNYLGTTHLTRRLLPLLQESARKTRDARVVMVVSKLHERGRNRAFFEPPARYGSWDAYGQSKLGLMHFAMELHRRSVGGGLAAYCLHPGEVFTNVADVGLAGHPVLEGARNLLAPLEAFALMSPVEGAQTSIFCATAAEAQGGHYYRDCSIARASNELADTSVAARLWEENHAWVDSLTRGADRRAADAAARGGG